MVHFLREGVKLWMIYLEVIKYLTPTCCNLLLIKQNSITEAMASTSAPSTGNPS